MLQESVDSFDNTRKASAVKTESNRPLKSLSDSKGRTFPSKLTWKTWIILLVR
jgi:hypothetical protein